MTLQEAIEVFKSLKNAQDYKFLYVELGRLVLTKKDLESTKWQVAIHTEKPHVLVDAKKEEVQ